MAKVKYYYDPETLSYRKIEKSKARQIKNIALYIFLFLSGAMLVYAFSVPITKYESNISKTKIDSLSLHLKNTKLMLDEIQNHVNDNINFIVSQKDAIKKDKEKWEEEINRAKTEIKNKNLEIALVTEQLNDLLKASEIDQEKLKSRERLLRNDRITIGVIIAIASVILTQIVNLLINYYKRNKRIKNEIDKIYTNKDQNESRLKKITQELLKLRNDYDEERERNKILQTEKNNLQLILDKFLSNGI